MIQKAEHQQRGDQLLFVFAAKSDQDRRIEHAETRGRMARESHQRGRNEDGDQAE
jgi:hypothetical protein